MAKRGRPTKYQASFADQAYKYCLLGATNEKLAELFGVTTRTIDNWIAEIPQFFRAIQKGRDIANAEVAKALYRRALGYSHPSVKIFVHQGEPITVKYIEHYPPDTAAAFIWLKNRMPELWRDKPPSSESDDRLDEVVDLSRNGPAKPLAQSPTQSPENEG